MNSLKKKRVKDHYYDIFFIIILALAGRRSLLWYNYIINSYHHYDINYIFYKWTPEDDYFGPEYLKSDNQTKKFYAKA